MAFSSMGYLHNPEATPGAPYGPSQRRILGRAAFAAARDVIAAWPGYRPTPLVSLPGLASELGVGAIRYKDEATRFGLGSFKAPGGAYAVFRLLQREARGRAGEADVALGAVLQGACRDLAASLTVTCASAGNHGKAVAWGAQQLGCRCVVFVAANVGPERVAQIARYGAEVVRVDGTYDEAVRRAAAEAERCGWHVVSDTAYAGYLDVPRDVMQGYRVMADEIVQAWPPGSLPTHVFVQCGVGGLAAAVCAHFWDAWGPRRPRFVVIEPENAACMFATALEGRPARVEGKLDTSMVCLACGEVSLLAWEILKHGADDFITIPDAAETAVRARLRQGVAGDPPIRVHGSGAAGAAGLLVAVRRAEVRTALGLDRASRVLLIGSEGAV